jgi:hypothetical protein
MGEEDGDVLNAELYNVYFSSILITCPIIRK